MLSILTIGAALSFGMDMARADDDITEQQILKALTPEKKPLTRSLSVGPQADRLRLQPKASSLRHPRPLHAFAVISRTRRDRDNRQGQAEDRSRNQLRLQLGRNQR
jgi:hypothetical protein